MPHWPPSCSDLPEGLCAACSLCLATLPPAHCFAHSRSFRPWPGHHPFRDTSAGPNPDTPHASIPFTAYILELSHLSPPGYELCASRDHTLLITGGSWALIPGLAQEKNQTCVTIQYLEPPLGLGNTRKSFPRSPVMLGLREGLAMGSGADNSIPQSSVECQLHASPCSGVPRHYGGSWRRQVMNQSLCSKGTREGKGHQSR